MVFYTQIWVMVEIVAIVKQKKNKKKFKTIDHLIEWSKVELEPS